MGNQCLCRRFCHAEDGDNRDIKQDENEEHVREIAHCSPADLYSRYRLIDTRVEGVADRLVEHVAHAEHEEICGAVDEMSNPDNRSEE